MDEQEAREMLAAEIQRLRSLGYEELRRLFEVDVREITGPETGTMYTVEIESFFDDPKAKSGDLRVMASIDDGRGFRAFVPLTKGLIIAPDGTFVGE